MDLFLFCFRHVVTSTHCICAIPSYNNKGTPCLEESENQIQLDKNTIVVSGGSKSVLELDNAKWKLKWDIGSAYIRNTDVKKHEFGIIEIHNKYADGFFKHDALLKDSELDSAKIIPICLGALNLDKKINDKTEIFQLGWGHVYEEAPPKKDTGGKRDPVYSSCMTSQTSHESWSFQNCDMKRLKQPRNNNWACDKSNPPPDYEDGKDQRCREYFNMAGSEPFNLDLPKTLSETRLKDVDLIFVKDGKGDTHKCFNPTLLSKFGWCYLKDFREKHDEAFAKENNWNGQDAWGTCSPSCNKYVMKVSKFDITETDLTPSSNTFVKLEVINIFNIVFIKDFREIVRLV